MAYIQPRKNKAGEIVSYSIRVQRGYAPDGSQLKPYTATFKPDPNRTARQNEKALNAFVTDFENKCKIGLACDDRQTFTEYAEYVLGLKERQGIKHRTLERYKELLTTINQHIGFLKLSEIRPQHLNRMYGELLKNGTGKVECLATIKTNFKAYLKGRKLSQAELSRISSVPATTITSVSKGKPIKYENAEKLCAAMEIPTEELFTVSKNGHPLSNKTVLEYHHLVSTIMTTAEKELVIPYNPARKATPPKLQRKEVNYFEVEEIAQICECLEKEPIKWRTLVHLLMITGARRGEIAGLKWDVVDWDKSRIHICRSILYSTDIGIYEDTPKSPESNRYISLPAESMEILKDYREWYFQQAFKYADQWHNTGFLFFRESPGHIGEPMNPDGITAYLSDFSEKYTLPHINPHAFRHTQASILYFNGVDAVSISKRLGHAKVSTTCDIYAHIMKSADERSAEVVANAILRPKSIDIKKAE